MERTTMIRLTELAHRELAAVLQLGDIAIDTTAGNGHDTAFLAQCVGPTGIVYAFDIQPAAISSTKTRLTGLNLNNVHLIEEDHARLAEFIAQEHRGKIAAITFNLGYLPGGNHSVITQTTSTLQAIKASLGLLKVNGIITILAYRGHEGGGAECDAVVELLSQHSTVRLEIVGENSPESINPLLLIVRK